MATNYEKYFGTPEKLAYTIANNADRCLLHLIDSDICCGYRLCPLYNKCADECEFEPSEQFFIEWLQDESHDD